MSVKGKITRLGVLRIAASSERPERNGREEGWKDGWSWKSERRETSWEKLVKGGQAGNWFEGFSHIYSFIYIYYFFY